MCCLTVKLPSLAQRIASSHYKGSADKDEDEDDVDAEYADTDAAVRLRGGVWTRDCVRKGDAVRVGGDQDIGRVNCPGFLLSVWGKRFLRCLNHSWWGVGGEGGEGRNNSGHEEPEDGQGGKRKRKRKQKNCGWWRDDTGGPVVTRKAGEVPSQLLTISLPHHCQAMEIILADHENSFKDIDDSSNTVETSVAVVNQFALNVKKNELSYMLALVQLTMNVDSLKCDSKKNLSKPKMTEIAEKYALNISRTTFNDWLSCGQKLTLLCAGRTLYLLTIIAALDMRTCITWQCGEDDILSIANTLREVKYGILPQLPLFYNVPKPVGEAPETYQYHFRNIVQLDTVFDSIETNYPKLPAQSLEWDSQTIPSWDSVSLPEFTTIPSNTIKTPLAFKKTPLPFKHADRDTWTEQQSKPLFICDANDKLLSLVFTVPDAIHQSLEDAILHLEAAMPGKFREEDSWREKFKYYSCHYTWYNRFGEKGFTAPADVHPNNICKDHDGRVNFTQRFPHQAKEITEHREEYDILSKAFHPFFEYLRPQRFYL
ncbi:hypothetical protein B0H10DRAFT_1948715 [Mycena sp. CBHHK59/15]|nr:hypothetical protein B0H10DRAFT_1948715 [Mycena sp. CBHHK59/15]